MINNIATVTADEFIDITLGEGVPGNYLAVVSDFQEELKLRDLLREKIKEIAETEDYVSEEIDYYEPRFQKYKIIAQEQGTDRVLVQLRDGKAWYSNDELQVLVEETQNIKSKMEAKLQDGKKGIAFYGSLNTDRHYISLLSSDDVPDNWIILGILCDERPEEEVSEIFKSLKQPITFRVTV